VVAQGRQHGVGRGFGRQGVTGVLGVLPSQSTARKRRMKMTHTHTHTERNRGGTRRV
jgi:hypothetical protein